MPESIGFVGFLLVYYEVMNRELMHEEYALVQIFYLNGFSANSPFPIQGPWHIGIGSELDPTGTSEGQHAAVIGLIMDSKGTFV